MSQAKHRGELGFVALPQELESAAVEARRFLGSCAAPPTTMPTSSAGAIASANCIALDPGAREPLTVEAELLYQSIAFRWAENLRSYDAEETQRFGRYYAGAAGASAIPLARAMATIATR